MAYLMNAWYVGAWSEEVGDGDLLARTLLDRKVVLFRDGKGRLAALEDRCPHRFVPLSAGKLKEGMIICPYHGLRFDRTGACVMNPHGGGIIPPGTGVPSWPVAERHTMVWIWFGNPAQADEALIPDFAWLTSPEYRTRRARYHGKFNYRLLVDNIMDTSHVEFLHQGSFGGGADDAMGAIKVRSDKRYIYCDRWSPGGQITPVFARVYDPQGPVDRWQYSRWAAPGNMSVDAGVVKTGHPPAEGVAIKAAHIATPETETTTHYFLAGSRNFALDSAMIDESFTAAQKQAVGREDIPMLELQQEAMGDAEFWKLRPVILASDQGAVRVRRTLDKMLGEQHAAGNVAV